MNDTIHCPVGYRRSQCARGRSTYRMTGLRAIIAEEDQPIAPFDIPTSIPGISTVTALSILIEMPELGTMSGKQRACLAGLAPISRHLIGGKAKNAFGAAVRSSAGRCACQHFARPVMTTVLKSHTINSSRRANHPKWPSLPSCESWLSLQTRYFGVEETGPKTGLDPHGYCFANPIAFLPGCKINASCKLFP